MLIWVMCLVKKKKSEYFGKDVEQYVNDYQRIEGDEEKRVFFTKYLYGPFCDLIDGILQGFKFDYISDTKEDLIQEGIFFLLDGRLEMFDSKFGAKAYSYFGTALKRYFIVRNSDSYNKLKNHVSVDDISVDFFVDGQSIEEGYVDRVVSTLTHSVDDIFFEEADRDVAGKILKVWNQTDDLSMFKKASLYSYMMEKYEVPQSSTIKVLEGFKKKMS